MLKLYLSVFAPSLSGPISLKAIGPVCSLAVISVPQQMAEKLEPSDDSSGPSLIDYSEKRSLPISIPDYQTLPGRSERYVVCACLELARNASLNHQACSKYRVELFEQEFFESGPPGKKENLLFDLKGKLAFFALYQKLTWLENSYFILEFPGFQLNLLIIMRYEKL